MPQVKAQHIDNSISVQSNGIVSDYLMLVKVGLSSMVVFTALASFLIASGLEFSWIQLIMLGVGGFCVTGASNTMNQVLEKDYDILMKRTMNRPIAAGRMTISSGVLFAGMLCLIGITALATFNVWASFFGMLAFVTYAFVYTPLKRYSRAAVLVGAIAGAMPMSIGVVAFDGELTWLAVLLFGIQFAWQYPHFWAIGYLGHEDYNKAGFKFVPMNGDSPCKSIAVSSICFCAVLLVITSLLIYSGYVGYIAGGAMAIMGIVYLVYAVLFYQKFDMQSAKELMFSSLLYIPLVMLILIVDQI